MLQHTSITDVCTTHTPHLLQQLDTGSLRPRVFWTSDCLSGLSAWCLWCFWWWPRADGRGRGKPAAPGVCQSSPAQHQPLLSTACMQKWVLNEALLALVPLPAWITARCRIGSRRNTGTKAVKDLLISSEVAHLKCDFPACGISGLHSWNHS